MEEEKYFDYANEPGLKLKKELTQNDGEPLISIITPYYNAKTYIKETAYSILNQTFPYWEWIILNDGSTEEGTKETLDEILKLDKRIRVINKENKGRIIARDEAIEEAKTELIFTIDSDDQIDKTMLECAYWALRTNPEASWAYADMVNFDGKQFLWKKIFNLDIEKRENLLPVCALIKKQAILEVGGYGVVDDDVHEDWHLWLRLLEKGHIPIRMNFYGFWYRNKKEGGILASINSDKARDLHARQEIEKQADKIKNEVSAIQFPTSFEPDYDSYPYIFDWKRKPIYEKGKKKNLLFIFPWLHVGGADKFNYDLISALDKEKYEITVVTTEPSDYVWRSKFEEHATVFDLTTFLNRNEWSAFLHYLIYSRNIDFIMQSNSFYGYYILPWLKSEFPEVIITDYLHSQNWSWRNGEYPRESTALSRILDKTYTCTKYLTNVMTNEMGRINQNMKPVYIGVDYEDFDSDKVKIENYPEITKYENKYKDKKIILFLARISEEKRPLFIVHVLKKICEERKDTILFVVGDGPELKDMKKLAEKLGLIDNIIFFGMQKDAKPFYKLAHVQIIASLTEGLTLTTYESLSMETPVVTADVGGQKELVDETCGKVVQNIQTAKDNFYDRNYKQEEIDRYANALIEIIENPKYQEMTKTCRKKVINGFSIKDMVKNMDKEITTLIEQGTTIKPEVVEQNKELYAQYLVIFNQIDRRIYGVDSSNANYQHVKDKLWANPLWRAFIKFLQKTGLMRIMKKHRLDIKFKQKMSK